MQLYTGGKSFFNQKPGRTGAVIRGNRGMSIKLFNSATRRKEEFRPKNPPAVLYYACGPTVYDYIHIGNARAFIIFDLVRRYLNYRGFQVTMVQNYTDIDDKMIRRAAEEGVEVEDLAERFIAAYQEDAAALKIRPADHHPRATAHVPQIITLIRRLEENGLAYQSGGDVYYDTVSFPAYGALSGQKREELMAGARVDPDEKKRDPLDFALWKNHREGEPFWDSPWGSGRPGWHVECSAMAMHYLKETIDLHAGGIDLLFPHHENEIAQSAGATGKPFSRHWLHVGYLNIDEQKMSKSLGNVLTVRELVRRYNPLDLRFLILSAHYRSPLNFGDEPIASAKRGRERLQETVDNLFNALEKADGTESVEADRLAGALTRAQEHFLVAMDDDFNTAGAIAVLFELAREANIYLKQGFPYWRALLEQVLSFFREADSIFEILELEKGGFSLEEEIARAIEVREAARRRRDWAVADRIRAELAEKGIILEDTPHGVRWKRRT